MKSKSTARQFAAPPWTARQIMIRHGYLWGATARRRGFRAVSTQTLNPCGSARAQFVRVRRVIPQVRRARRRPVLPRRERKSTCHFGSRGYGRASANTRGYGRASANNIKVFVRVRPLNDKEESGTSLSASTVSVDEKSSMVTLRSQPARSFTFDGVAGEDASQDCIYSLVAAPYSGLRVEAAYGASVLGCRLGCPPAPPSGRGALVRGGTLSALPPAAALSPSEVAAPRPRGARRALCGRGCAQYRVGARRPNLFAGPGYCMLDAASVLRARRCCIRAGPAP